MTTTPLELLATMSRRNIAAVAVTTAADNAPELVTLEASDILEAAIFIRLVKPRPSLYAAARDAVDVLMTVEEVARPADLLAALMVGLELASETYQL